jgi:hypothetical protein
MSLTLSLSEEDEIGILMPHDDVLVVIITMVEHDIHQILVENGSSANILYWPVLKQMNIDWERIKLFESPLVGFAREKVQSIGLISLPIIAGIALELRATSHVGRRC